MTDWTDSRTTQLKDLFFKGLSYSLIAKALGEGLTRCAVGAKLDRMKLTEDMREHLPRAQITRHPNSYGGNSTNPSGWRGTKSIEQAVAKKHLRSESVKTRFPETKMPVPCRRVSILELDNNACRWPLWGDKLTKHLYCGIPEASLLDGRPYCHTHSALAKGSKGQPFEKYQPTKREQPQQINP